MRASGTTVTEVFGDVRDISRFRSDCFAACNGTSPAEASSGNRVIDRLSLRGNRRLNHAIHMAAVTQIRYRHTNGRAKSQGVLLCDASRAAQRVIVRWLGGSVGPPMPCRSAVFARSESTESAKARLTIMSKRASSSSTAGRCSVRTSSRNSSSMARMRRMT
jgi:hypothetical protein